MVFLCGRPLWMAPYYYYYYYYYSYLDDDNLTDDTTRTVLGYILDFEHFRF